MGEAGQSRDGESVTPLVVSIVASFSHFLDNTFRNYTCFMLSS